MANIKISQDIFDKFISIAKEMVSFTYDEVINRLDSFLNKVERDVDSGTLNDAQENRIKFKVDSKDIIEVPIKFSGELSDLVIKFVQIARVAVTLG